MIFSHFFGSSSIFHLQFVNFYVLVTASIVETNSWLKLKLMFMRTHIYQTFWRSKGIFFSPLVTLVFHIKHSISEPMVQLKVLIYLIGSTMFKCSKHIFWWLGSTFKLSSNIQQLLLKECGAFEYTECIEYIWVFSILNYALNDTSMLISSEWFNRHFVRVIFPFYLK